MSATRPGMAWRAAKVARSIGLAVALTASPGLARAEITDGGAASTTFDSMVVNTAATAAELTLEAVETSAGWCVRGATFAVLFSAAFSVPGMVFGFGAPYSSARATAAALTGCGIAVTWRTAAKLVAYVDAVVNPLPPMPMIPANRKRSLIETSG